MAESKEILIRIKGESRDAERAFQDVSEKANRTLNTLSKHSNVLGKALKWGAVAAGAAIGSLTIGIKKCVESSATQEKAESMLAQAMKQHGTYTEEAYRSLLNFASAQQKVTTFGDEATIAAMQQLQTFGMSTETMKQATKAAQDLAAAKGIDLATAANLVGRAYAGNTATLSRYGIVLDQAKLEAEGFSYVLETLNTQFGGAAQAEADTYAGRLQQMQNAFGDLKETIGFAVMPALADMATTLRDLFAGLAESGAISDILGPISEAFSRLAPIIGETVAEIAKIFSQSDIFSALIDMIAGVIDALIPIIREIGPPLMQIGTIIAQFIVSALQAIQPIIVALAPIIGHMLQLVADLLQRMMPFIDAIMQQISQVLVQVLTAIEPYLGQIIDALLMAVDEILPPLMGILPAILGVMQPILDIILQLIDPLTTVFSWLVKIMAFVEATVLKVLTWVIERIRSFSGIWSTVWNGVKSVFEGVWHGIVWLKDTIIMPVVEALKKIWDGLSAVWQAAWDGLKAIVKGAALTMLRILRPIAYALDVMQFWSGEAKFEGPILRAIEAVENWHRGGPIAGDKLRGREIVLPLGIFKGGEWVIQESAVRALGEHNMALINQGVLPTRGVIINVNVGQLYGSAEYVRMLAREISRELPAVEFGVWSRV